MLSSCGRRSAAARVSWGGPTRVMLSVTALTRTRGNSWRMSWSSWRVPKQKRSEPKTQPTPTPVVIRATAATSPCSTTKTGAGVDNIHLTIGQMGARVGRLNRRSRQMRRETL